MNHTEPCATVADAPPAQDTIVRVRAPAGVLTSSSSKLVRCVTR